MFTDVQLTALKAGLVALGDFNGKMPIVSYPQTDTTGALNDIVAAILPILPTLTPPEVPVSSTWANLSGPSWKFFFSPQAQTNQTITVKSRTMMTLQQMDTLKNQILGYGTPIDKLYIFKFPIGTNTTAGQKNEDCVKFALDRIFSCLPDPWNYPQEVGHSWNYVLVSTPATCTIAVSNYAEITTPVF